MLDKLDTKKKLFLFPAIFILIMAVSAIVYSHWSEVVNKRSEAASKTEAFSNAVLKGRISVYQYLRNPNDKTAQKVRDDFSALIKNVGDYKKTLTLEKNKTIADDIVVHAKEYVSLFDKFSSERIKDFANGTKDESQEIKTNIAQMVQVGLELEKMLNEIHDNAVEVKNESVKFLATSK